MEKKAYTFWFCFVLIVLSFAGCTRTSDNMELGNSLYESRRYIEAVDAYRKAEKESLSRQDAEHVKSQLAALTARIADEKISRAEAQWQEGTTTRNCDQAVTFLNQYIDYDDAKGNIRSRIREYESQKKALTDRSSDLAAKAREELSLQNWSAALEGFQSAIRIDPYNEQAVSLKQQALRQRDAHYSDNIADLCSHDKWQEAFELLAVFAEETPTPESSTLDQLEQQIEQTKLSVVTAEAEQFKQQQMYLTAYTHLNKHEVAPSRPDLVERIKNNGCRYYIETAETEKDDNIRDFHAFAAALKATILQPENQQANQLFERYSRRVEESLEKEIGFATFESPSSEPDAGRNFRILLADAVRPYLPYGYNIAEQKKVEVIIEDHGFDAQIHIYGIDFLVHGEVMEFDVERGEVTNTVTDWVEVPTQERNPEIDDFRQEYGPDRSRWPRIPSETIETTSLREVTYQKGHTSIRGDIKIRCMLKISEENIDLQNIFTITKEESAPFQTGVPRADIALIEKVSFSKGSLKSQLMDEVVEQVSQWLIESIENPHKRYLEQSRRFVEGGFDESAVEALAKGYLYSKRTNVPADDETFAKIKQAMLYDLTE